MEKSFKRKSQSPSTSAQTALEKRKLDDSAYLYQPLATATSIRIIVLDPSPNLEDDLCCKIIHADRKQLLRGKPHPPYYEPVSYTWDNNNGFPKCLLCDDVRRRINIALNVDEILRYLRMANQIRYLWIDSICINQADLEEKATQVQMMGDIYAEGAFTHIYLYSVQPLDRAFKVFNELYRPNFERDRAFGWTGELAEEFFGDDDVQALLQHPWFTRRWVLQEAARSQRSIFRSKDSTFDRLAFERAMYHLGRRTGIDKTDRMWRSMTVFKAANAVKNILHSDVLRLLEQVDTTECSNPSDRLFSLYGLLNDSFKALLPKVDYTLSAVDIFTQLVDHYSRRSEGPREVMGALLKFGSLYDKNELLPSWVPAWTHPCMSSFHATSDVFGTGTGTSPAGTSHSVWTMVISAEIEDIHEPLTPVASVLELEACITKLISLLPVNTFETDKATMSLARDILLRFGKDGDTDVQSTWPTDIPQFENNEDAITVWNERLHNSVICGYRESRSSSTGDARGIVLAAARTRRGNFLANMQKKTESEASFGPILPSLMSSRSAVLVLRPEDPSEVLSEQFTDLRELDIGWFSAGRSYGKVDNLSTLPRYRLIGQARRPFRKPFAVSHNPTQDVVLL